jgi:hypothetical protein
MINMPEKNNSLTVIDGVTSMTGKTSKIDNEQMDSSEEELAAVQNKAHQKTIQTSNGENRQTSSSEELADENSSSENGFDAVKGALDFISDFFYSFFIKRLFLCLSVSRTIKNKNWR